MHATSMVDVSGLVHRPGLVDLADLPRDQSGSRVRRSPRRSPIRCALHDVLAAASLDIDAEVLVIIGRCGRSLAVPVRDALAAGSVLVDRRGRTILDLPGWSEARRGLDVEAIRAVTFTGFLSHPVGDRPGDGS